MTQDDIVQRLWKLCEVLRDDGITELVSLLFVKMEYERVQNHTSFEHKLPDGCCLEPVLSLA